MLCVPSTKSQTTKSQTDILPEGKHGLAQASETLLKHMGNNNNNNLTGLQEGKWATPVHS